MGTNENVVDRIPKLSIIYSGRLSDGTPAFNNGNLYRTDWKPLKTLLLSMDETATWEHLSKDRSTRGYVYRDAPNRHGHSNNLPSYFAFGHNSLEEYHSIASQEAWTRYIDEHRECCGVTDFLATIGAAVFCFPPQS